MPIHVNQFVSHINALGEYRSCVLDNDGVYRYLLRIEWNKQLPLLVVIGLNPSTADHTRDDATVRRWRGYAKDWGHGGLCILNLFAYRATDPRALQQAADPVGKDNDYYIDRYTGNGERVLACWGRNGGYLQRDLRVWSMLRDNDVVCLGYTKDGHPLHPLRLRRDLQPMEYVYGGLSQQHPAEG